MKRALIVLSIVLHKQLVNALGLKLPGSEWSLLGLVMGIITASCHDGGKQIPKRGYILLKGRIEQNLEVCQKLVADLVQTSG